MEVKINGMSAINLVDSPLAIRIEQDADVIIIDKESIHTLIRALKKYVE